MQGLKVKTKIRTEIEGGGIGFVWARIGFDWV